MDDFELIEKYNHFLSQMLTNTNVKTNIKPERRLLMVYKLLEKLRKCAITLDTLLKTKVGFTVNKVRMNGFSQEITKFAQKIMNEWKQLLPQKKYMNKKNDCKTINEKIEETSEDEEIEDKENDIVKQILERIKRVKVSDKILNVNNFKDQNTPQTNSNSAHKRRFPLKCVTFADLLEEGFEAPKLSNERNNQKDVYFSEINSKKFTKNRSISAVSQSSSKSQNLKKRPQNKTTDCISIVCEPNISHMISKRYVPKTRRRTKLPPIGRLPEYQTSNFASNSVRAELTSSETESTSTRDESNFKHELKQSLKERIESIDGHQLYNKIVKERKRERSSSGRSNQLSKRRKSFNEWKSPSKNLIINVDPNNLSKYKVKNWPIPNTQPVITPIDRLKIVRSRVIEDSAESTFQESDETKHFDKTIDESISRARSAKSFGMKVARNEHKPLWFK